MSLFAVIIPAAGDSSRFTGFNAKKPFVPLMGKAIWLRTVEHFVGRGDVSEVILVLAKADLKDFHAQFQAELRSLNVQIVEGGDSRAESVRNGINALQNPADFIAIHDAARPLLTQAGVSQIFAAAQDKNSVIPAVPVSSTVKSVADDGLILKTVDRSSLVLAQTPQVFRRDVLENAYRVSPSPSAFTDEASLVEASGHSVFVVDGWPMNIKITTNEDFRMAEALLKSLADRPAEQ